MANPSSSSTASSQTEKSFKDSLKSFETRLSAQERKNFNLTTLKDLKQTISQIQTQQANKSKAMNLARLQRFLEGVTQIGKVVEVFANSSQYVAFVWGPMKFLLQVASNFADAFDTLLGAYEQVGEAIPLIEQHHSLFTGNSYIEEAIAKVYEDILEFHRRALRFFTLPTWHQVFKSVWKDFNTRFGHILQDLKRHKALIESQSGILQAQQYQTDRLRIIDEIFRSELAERKRRYLEILQWATAADSALDHSDMCQVRQEFPRSGAWLLRNSKYSAWRKDSVPRISTLWMYGIPGAGKTVLASILIDDCMQDVDAQTAYFYCKHGDPQRTTCVSVLRTLMCQLIKHDHDLLPWIYDEHLTSGQLLLTSVELCKKILKTILLNTKKTYLIVDGLDECEPIQRKMLLSILDMILVACDAHNPGQLRILIVSQDEPDIRKSITLCCELPLQRSDNEDDINEFVKNWCRKIQDKFELSDDEREFIIKTTCYRANGMFLFVKLVMKNLLEQVNIHRLCNELQPDTFPIGLEQAYDRILDRLSQGSSEEWSMAKVILGWMVCAKRPLRWHEIQGASSIDLEENDINFDEMKFRVHIRDICGSLVTQLPGDRLELVHTTARHYLTQNRYVKPSMVECYLTGLCLKYLTFECFDSEQSDDDRHNSTMNGFYAFQEYAAVHWSDHLTRALKNGPETLSAALDETKGTWESAMGDFVARYHLSEEADEDETANPVAVCEAFQGFEFFDDLRVLFLHLQRQKSKGVQAFEDIDPPGLKVVVDLNHLCLENLASSGLLAVEERQKLSSYYGKNWFKCPRPACFYFHEGFENERMREQHMLRHERPFRCPIEECETGYRFGFSAKKDLDKHTLIHHPEFGQSGVAFLKLRKAQTKSNSRSPDPAKLERTSKHPAEFQCEKCSKAFTRNSILKDHMRVHTNEKPFGCTVCSKVFVRKNDLIRHEKSHTGGTKFTCQGVRALPPKNWGCGKVFSRADALASHFASKGCNAPLLEENRLRKQWETRLLDGSGLPIPHALLDSSVLGSLDWRRLIGADLDDNETYTPEEDASRSVPDASGDGSDGEKDVGEDGVKAAESEAGTESIFVPYPDRLLPMPHVQGQAVVSQSAPHATPSPQPSPRVAGEGEERPDHHHLTAPTFGP